MVIGEELRKVKEEEEDRVNLAAVQLSSFGMKCVFAAVVGGAVAAAAAAAAVQLLTRRWWSNTR